MRWNVLCNIFRRSRSWGPKLRVGWLIFDMFISHLFIKGNLGEASKISGGWKEKSIGGSGVTIEGICGSSGKRSKTREVDKEVRK